MSRRAIRMATALAACGADGSGGGGAADGGSAKAGAYEAREGE